MLQLIEISPKYPGLSTLQDAGERSKTCIYISCVSHLLKVEQK